MISSRSRFRAFIGAFGTLALASLAADELLAQGFVAGTPEPSITLDRQDRSDGSAPAARGPAPTFRPPAAQGVPRGNTNYPGALRTGPRGANTLGRNTPLNQRVLRGGKRERSPILTQDRNGGGGIGRRTPGGLGGALGKKRNWALGGDKWRPSRPGRTLAELLEQRELARTKYEHGGGYDRDLRDYNDAQQQILNLQDQQLQTLRANGASPRTLRQAQNNRGLNAQRYRGVRDTRWPVGERATSRWLNNRQ
jgi:hypothetical protein